MGVREKEEKKAKWWWRKGAPCVGGEIECDLSGTNGEKKRSVPKRIWMKVVGKKKTVPVNGVPDQDDGAMKKCTSDERKDNNLKGKNKAILIHQDQKQKPISSNSIQTINNQSKASKCDHHTEPSPLYRVSDPSKTQTQTLLNHSDKPSTSQGPKKPERKTTGCFDPAGLIVIMVIIALVLLFGKLFAIFCVCAWFYVIFRLKADKEEKEKEKKKKDEEIDLNAEEYKKKVVLQGFLERDKKRPAFGA